MTVEGEERGWSLEETRGLNRLGPQRHLAWAPTRQESPRDVQRRGTCAETREIVARVIVARVWFGILGRVMRENLPASGAVTCASCYHE